MQIESDCEFEDDGVWRTGYYCFNCEAFHEENPLKPYAEDKDLAMDELTAWCGKKTGRRFRISGSFVYHFVTLTEDVFATTCSTGEDDNLATAIIQALIKAETAKNA